MSNPTIINGVIAATREGHDAATGEPVCWLRLIESTSNPVLTQDTLCIIAPTTIPTVGMAVWGRDGEVYMGFPSDGMWGYRRTGFTTIREAA